MRCDWEAAVSALPLPWQRLACNLVMVAADALPRGGAVAVRALAGAAPGLEVTAEGDSVNLPEEQRAALAAICARRRAHAAQCSRILYQSPGAADRRPARARRSRARARRPDRGIGPGLSGF